MPRPFKALKYCIAGVILLPFIAIAGVLLFWLGRSEPTVARELVVDEIGDDPGTDVDGDPS